MRATAKQSTTSARKCTTRSANKALAERFGAGTVTIYRGRGYYYFESASGTSHVSSLYVYSLTQVDDDFVVMHVAEELGAMRGEHVEWKYSALFRQWSATFGDFSYTVHAERDGSAKLVTHRSGRGLITTHRKTPARDEMAAIRAAERHIAGLAVHAAHSEGR